MNCVIFWFRRDLRLEDNTALTEALKSGKKIVPVFIFDRNIIDELPKNDARISFIHQHLEKIHLQLVKLGSGILIYDGNPLNEWKKIIEQFQPEAVYFNHDYEPYALQRDKVIIDYLENLSIQVSTFKDHVFFEKEEVLTKELKPYTVYTAYKNKWLENFSINNIRKNRTDTNLLNQFVKLTSTFPTLENLGFKQSEISVPAINLSTVFNYHLTRDTPEKYGTTFVGTHLRFGTISIRELVNFK